MKKEQNSFMLVVISFLSALILWVVVMNMSKPLIDDHISVPINIEVEDSESIAQLGHVYTLSDARNVRINYKVRSDFANKINASKIRAYVDVSNATNLSENLQVHIEYLDPAIEYNISSVNIFPQLVSVKISDLETKYIAIGVDRKGNLSENETVGGITLDPSGVTISGAKEDIERINEARIDVDLAGHSDTFVDKAKIKFYDKNKRQINDLSSNVKISTDEVNYTVLAHYKKKIKLMPVLKGEVIDGCTMESVSVVPEYITVSGARSYLDGMSTFDLPEIDITGVSESKTIESFIPNEILPVGIKYIGDDEKIDVNLTVTGNAKIIIAPRVQSTEE